MTDKVPDKHKLVIVGGGFGGLYAAKALKNLDAGITLVDRRNFHLFQPLLYQVATGALSPGEIASPLRFVLSRNKNTSVVMAEVTGIDPARRRVLFSDGELPYDTLILATGSRHHYFGNEQWEAVAPGLKTIEDATEIRGRILEAFEHAEREADPAVRQAWLTFVLVGGGATGVELAGALGEIANDTLLHDFRHIDSRAANIILIEGEDRVLPPFPRDLSARAERDLIELGVRAITNARVTGVDSHGVTFKIGDRVEHIASRTILWAAGVKASPLGQMLAKSTGAPLDRTGRVIVEPDLSVPGHPEILVIGDLACFRQDGKPLPGVAPVAMQQGRYAAHLVAARLKNRTRPPFRYFN